MCCNIAWSFNFHLSVIQCNISSKSFSFWSFNFSSAFNLHIHNLELVPWYIFRGKCHFYKSVSIILARIIHLTEVTKPIKNFNAYFTFQLWVIFSASIYLVSFWISEGFSFLHVHFLHDFAVLHTQWLK